MFAVVRTGGKQYRVAPGDKIVVEKLDGNAGDKITLGEVLLAGDGSKLQSTSGLTVAAEIIAQAKGEKVTVFKKRRRHNYRRKKGHRQHHTILRIVAIGDHKAEKKPTAKAETKPAPKSETPAAHAKAKTEQKAADVAGTPTENPAPAKESQANPQPKVDVEAAPKKAPAKKAGPAKSAAKPASTKNAAPAKAAAKKSPKKKKK
jgi:large subunit ribosomal protein L21